MKAEDLLAIKQRCERATPPPWGVYHNLNGWHYTKPGPEGPEGPEPVLTSYDQTKADVEFIAAARDDVPDLVAEVERLECENARLREAIAYLMRARLLASTLEYTDS